MNTTATYKRKPMAFRFREDLVGVIKDKARKENRSINNFLESFLIQSFDIEGKMPNATTLAAMQECEENDNLETLDLDNFKEYVKSL